MRNRSFIPVGLDTSPEDCHQLIIPEKGIPIHTAKVQLDRCVAILNGLQVCGENTAGGGFVIHHDDVMQILYNLSGSLGQVCAIIDTAMASNRVVNGEVS